MGNKLAASDLTHLSAKNAETENLERELEMALEEQELIYGNTERGVKTGQVFRGRT